MMETVLQFTREEQAMTQHAYARIVESERVELPFNEQVSRIARAVADGHDGDLNRALESVSWERRGLLGRLTQRPRPARIPGGGG
jgi:hypothetical protein